MNEFAVTGTTNDVERSTRRGMSLAHDTSSHGNPCGISHTAVPRCSSAVTYDGATPLLGELVRIPSYKPTERYSTILTCAGFDFLLTRHNVKARLPPKGSQDPKGKWTASSWETLYRVAPRRNRRAGGKHEHPRSSSDYTVDGLALAAPLGISHNAAFVCQDDRYLVGFGGRDLSGGEGETSEGDTGIWRIESEDLAALATEHATWAGTGPDDETPSLGRNISWRSRRRVLNGSHPGCLELRKDNFPVCAFDGRLSAVEVNL